MSSDWASQFPKIISDPYGASYVLAATEEEALAEARHNWGDEVERTTAAGWMHEVSYPEDYDSRDEWEASQNFCDEWWEGCAAPVNGRQRAIRAWEVFLVERKIRR